MMQEIAPELPMPQFELMNDVVQPDPAQGGAADPNGVEAKATAKPTLSTILLGFDDAAFNIATYLSAKDTLGLHAVNRGWRTVLSKHEESLFENYLKRDFVEGQVLSYVARKRDLSRKNLYLAFLKRWSLPKQGDENTRVCITWTRPHSSLSERESSADGGSSDVSSLAFIARVGDADDPESCALLQWNPEYNIQKRLGQDNDQLIIDKCWSEHAGGLSIQQNWEANEFLESMHSDDPLLYELEDVLTQSHTLTLHVVDCQLYQVATLMEETPMTDLEVGPHQGDADFETIGHGFELPKLHGVPPKGSPYYREFTERDFACFQRGEYPEDPFLEYMPVWGSLLLDEGEDDEGDRTLSLHHEQKGLNFKFDQCDVSTIIRPTHVCSFLRALMKQKCASREVTRMSEVGAGVAQQPDWVQTDKIIDTITSFASFEEQAGNLRLVCHRFEASALRQLERKLEKTKVIGFNRGECGDWFKAQVRQGWSETCLTGKESVIDDALWLASCRCMGNLCKDKEGCPTANKPPEYRDRSSINGKSLTLDMNRAREQLAEEGRFVLEQRPPDRRPHDNCRPLDGIECSFKREKMSLWSLCDKVKSVIHRNVEYADEMYDEYGFGGGIPDHFQRFYGVSKSISSRQFIRSLFLVLAKSARTTGTKDGTVSKKARLGPIDEVTIGRAESSMAGVDGSSHYCRSMTIYRFYSAAHEPMEICIEYYGGFIF